MVNNEVPLPTHYRSGCIQTPAGAGVCCYTLKHPPLLAWGEEINLLKWQACNQTAIHSHWLQIEPCVWDARASLAARPVARARIVRATWDVRCATWRLLDHRGNLAHLRTIQYGVDSIQCSAVLYSAILRQDLTTVTSFRKCSLAVMTTPGVWATKRELSCALYSFCNHSAVQYPCSLYVWHSCVVTSTCKFSSHHQWGPWSSGVVGGSHATLVRRLAA